MKIIVFSPSRGDQPNAVDQTRIHAGLPKLGCDASGAGHGVALGRMTPVAVLGAPLLWRATWCRGGLGIAKVARRDPLAAAGSARITPVCRSLVVAGCPFPSSTSCPLLTSLTLIGATDRRVDMIGL